MRRKNIHEILLILVGFPLLLLLISISPVTAADVEIGSVIRLQNNVLLNRNGQSEALYVGASIQLNDKIETETDARLEILFVDGTKLTMGDNAKIMIDEYVFRPDQGIGRIFFNILKGSFRMITGNVAKLEKKEVAVQTPVAYVGVRGTDFFAGNALGKYGVLLFDGLITVRNDAGGRILSVPGTGVNVAGPDILPSEVIPWGEKRVRAALQSVSFK